METILQTPSENERKLAKKSLDSLRKSKLKKKSTIKLKIEEGEEITIPNKAYDFLKQFLESMAEGDSISLMSNETELTTQQGANILKISRPHLVKLLEAGSIPFIKVGSHRRIALKNILKYKQSIKEAQAKRLDELAEIAQGSNLGY